jgi:drug/metabolite transporter (DMT)-like permease
MNNWIFFSALMFGFSVCTYVLTRKLQVAKVDNRIISYAVGALPLPALFIYNLLQGANFGVELGTFFMLACTGIFFSYLGNKLSIEATKDAPNPGYSLIIQKSYAPFTALVGVLLFNQVISLAGVMAIFIIIISAAQILIGSGPVKFSGSKGWIIRSFGAFFLFGVLSIVSKYIMGQNVTPYLLAFFNFFFAGIAFSIDYRKALQPSELKKLSLVTIITLLIIGTSNALFNIAMFTAIKQAPNIGYVNIINSSSITAITLLSALLFKDKLTLQKILGVVGVTCGLVLLFI